MIQSDFNEVSLLITHFNRSLSLERLLVAFNELNCTFSEIIVSDDCSSPSHLDYVKGIQSRFGFKLVTSDRNRGLGNNINKGQKEVSSPFTLYVQEDFVPTDLFVPRFAEALEILKRNGGIDFIRFFALFPYPDMRHFNDNFSVAFYNKWNFNHLKFYCYSDNPHLRRSSFFEKFGHYAEGVPGDVTEFNMSLSFLKNGGKALIAKEYDGIFKHVNSPDEPSMMARKPWRQRKHPVLSALRAVYVKFRLIKNIIQLYNYPVKEQRNKS